MNIKAKLAVLLAVLLTTATAAGCGAASTTGSSSTGAATSSSTSTSTAQSAQSSTEAASTVELSTQSASGAGEDWQSASSTTIALNGTTAEITGAGAEAAEGIVTISKGGVYVLSGSFTGSIVVAASSGDDVQLVLNGVTLQADKNAAIYCSQADNLLITLADGTTNSVTDAENFAYSDVTNEEPDAAIFSKIDLTIDGTGSLTVVANYNNGIGTKDDLVVESGTLDITAANHGMRGRDSVTVLDADITISSGADGIQSNNDEDTSKGWITLSDGSYQITAGNDAVQAETALTVSGGSYTLTTGGGNTVTPADTTGSYKGLKAGTILTVSGGTFVIDSADDAVHSNADISITGGDFTISTGDDGVHADGNMTIGGSGTKIEILTCYEGLEAKTMTIEDGIVTIDSTDDGINIAGGNDSGAGGRFGADNFGSVSSDQWLLISGGTITVRAGSDAIDINGNGEMTGGTVDLTAALLGEGQTLDVDGSWTKTGGELTETGGSGPGGPGGTGGMGGGRAR
ncbi:MAG: carbohydrate-binding domain-containing protein [Oscillospiraceae bacterium]